MRARYSFTTSTVVICLLRIAFWMSGIVASSTLNALAAPAALTASPPEFATTPAITSPSVHTSRIRLFM